MLPLDTVRLSAILGATPSSAKREGLHIPTSPHHHIPTSPLPLPLLLLLPALLLPQAVAGAREAGPLTIIAPAAPGGGWDQTARALQQAFAKVEPTAHVQVENVPGAAGTIGLARFVASERGNPDALLITGLVMVGAIAMNRAPVDLAETTPIARLTGEPEVIVVPAASPFRTLDDLLGRFKEAPSSVSWGGGSAGGTDDLLVRLVAERIGVAPSQVNYIAFPGGGAALAAVLGEQVTAGVSGYGEFAGQIEAGALRVLAVSAPTRLPDMAAPTLVEQGIDVDLVNWRGIVAPPGLSDTERDAIVARLVRLVESDVWKASLARNGWGDALLAGAPFRQFLLAEQARVGGIVERLMDDGARGPGGSRFMPTPDTAPRVVLSLLVLLAAAWSARAARSTLARPFAASEHERSREGRRSGRGRAPALAATLVAHAVALPTIGFIPASTVLFAVAAALYGSGRHGRDIGVGLAAAISLYVGFTAGLGLSLPPDPLTRWMSGALR
jgi:putative tricarboxylic transport membrane protein